ncbi:uncharacterized protein K452DRAFT_50464 [Aplosporella prunicola CBS 121167]|uniref:Uncharacterized protein n=1 Tax=Aplosporella prunicola CBS 121167 TaxID=1176127 RepID=A0A6A6BE08_9PEZI|nr:uncharacterized protein K452DRAFT_50464 [Aplosporella prunicola CBS 121167]KAF2140721.1 hypothetical protein K452DRAFT_50464 [Aplosporella prunicola CBS 121167]
MSRNTHVLQCPLQKQEGTTNSYPSALRCHWLGDVSEVYPRTKVTLVLDIGISMWFVICDLDTLMTLCLYRYVVLLLYISLILYRKFRHFIFVLPRQQPPKPLD